MATEAIFFISLAMIVYTYAGYPALVFVLSRLFGRPVRRAGITPKVSVIIAAHNEERDIAAKIENTVTLDYPKDKLEIIVASDCSTDRTDEIVRSFARQGVILHRQSARLGKTVAQNQAAQVSTGEILVFSDATTMWLPDAVAKIVRSFTDPAIGCVAGQLIYVDAKDSAVAKGCRLYWNWEKQIKTSESYLGSLIGVSGCLYAVRRSCHQRLAGDMIDDFTIASQIHLQQLRTVYDPDAVAMEYTNKRSADEFRMRVRVIEQTMRTLYRYQSVLSLRRHGAFAFQMISHKLLRYAAPFLMISAYVSNLLLLVKGPLYQLPFTVMTLICVAALAGWTMDRLGYKLGPLAIPYYFVLANGASIVAFVKFIRADSRVTWEPVREAIEPRSKS